MASSARHFLESVWTSSRVRTELKERSLPDDIWAHACRLGWFDLLVPQERDGLGLDAVEAGALFEEAGRALFPGPLFDTVIIGGMCRAVLDIDPHDAVIAFAYAENNQDTRPSWNLTEIWQELLTGRKVLVPYGQIADVFVVLAGSERGPEIVVVHADAPGVKVIPLSSVDSVNASCEVSFDRTPGSRLSLTSREAHDFVVRAEALGHSMRAAEMLGMMERVLEMSVEYCKERHQFGKPIGSFQEVQHHLAEMKVLTDTLRATCYLSQIELASSSIDAPRMACVAKAYASHGVREVMERALQVHGGIGFTEEYHLQLYFKHGLTLEGVWGDASTHQRALGIALSEREVSSA